MVLRQQCSQTLAFQVMVSGLFFSNGCHIMDIFTMLHGGKHTKKLAHQKTRFVELYDLGSYNTSIFLTLSCTLHLYGAALVFIVTVWRRFFKCVFDGMKSHTSKDTQFRSNCVARKKNSEKKNCPAQQVTQKRSSFDEVISAVATAKIVLFTKRRLRNREKWLTKWNCGLYLDSETSTAPSSN